MNAPSNFIRARSSRIRAFGGVTVPGSDNLARNLVCAPIKEQFEVPEMPLGVSHLRRTSIVYMQNYLVNAILAKHTLLHKK